MILSTMKCPSCGTTFTADLDKDDTKCPKCGTPAGAVATVPSTKKIVG